MLPARAGRAAPRRVRATPAAGGPLGLEFWGLLLVMTGAVIGSALRPMAEWSLVALANYLWMCALLFRLEPRGTVLVMPHLITRLSSMVALVMIEFGAEMFELGTVGRPGPWSNALNLYSLLFCSGVLVTFKPLARLLDRRGAGDIAPVLDRFADLLAMAVVGLVGVIACAMILRGLQAGFPLLAGIDRFHFRRFNADKVTLYALNLKFLIAYALGFVAFVLPAAPWQRKAAGALFAIMVALYFLFGDKFFTQLAAFAAFAAPYLYRNHAQVRRRIASYAVIAALVVGLAMTVSVYIYSDGFTQTTAATGKKVSGRMVGQGELWYRQASVGAPMLAWNGPLIDRYVASLAVKQIDLFALQNSLGPNYFSNRYAPDRLRASLHRNAGSVTYTAATEPMGLVLFGWIGLAGLMLATGALVGLSCAYMAYAIAGRSIMGGLFAAYVYVQLRTTVVQAAPWVIGSIYSLRWLSMILAIELALVLLGSGAGTSRLRQGRPHRPFTPTLRRPAQPAVQRPLH